MYNASLLHLDELSLGQGELVWVQASGLGKDRRTRDRREVMKPLCLRVQAENPSEDRTSGYSEKSFLISLRAVWRGAQKGSEAEGEEMVERTSRESASKT